MTATYDFRPDTVFLYLCNKTLNLARTGAIKNRPWGYFYQGYAHGGLSTYKVKRNAWVSSFRHALKSIDYLKICITADSTLYDALTGLGIYHFWKGRYTKYIKKLPFIKDERKLGKQELEIAAQKGKFLKNTALYSLIWIYYNEKEINRAQTCAEKILREYPKNIIFLRAYCDVLFRQKKWTEAVRNLTLLLEILKKDPTENKVQEMECRYKRGLAYKFSGEPKLALAEMDRIFAYKTPDWAKEKTDEIREKTRREIKKIKQEISDGK